MRIRWDWLLFSQILALGSISVLIISSISSKLALNQIFFWFFGLLILYVVSHINYRAWLSYSVFFYILSLTFLLLLVFLGEPIRGSVRWIDIGFFRFQPSEIAKASAILVLATFFNFHSARNVNNLLLSAAIIFPVIFLTLIQPDIGNTFAFGAIWLGMVFVSGLRIKHLIAFFVALAFLSVIFLQFLAPYQKERLETFINPNSDSLGTGYNIIQSQIAIGSGLLFGKGYGHGSQSQLQFLPEAESDFIFASIAEQLGLIGATLLILLFVWLIYRITSYSKNSDKFGQLIIVGSISYLSVQFLVNIGMNLGLMPVTGITLPLISYGGSSLITNLFIFGVLFSVIKKSA